LKFCDNCGALCKPHPKEKKYVCPKCGWSCELDVLTVSRRLNPEEKIVVVGQSEREISTMPKTRVVCEKCGNEEAYWWMVQTRGVDESITQFYRCTRCGYTWRDYS